MQFDRKIFFQEYRRLFGGLEQAQVDGLNRLLWGYETYYGWWNFIPQIANSLSQVKHETAHSFMPVVEGYYLGDPNAPNYFVGNTDRVRRFQQRLRYYPHFGMGDIQLTWLENYEDQNIQVRRYFSELVADFEQRTGRKFNLVAEPTQALDPKISFAIMTIGMHLGTFREGHTLDRYINAKVIDHFTARNIVNGDRFYKNRQGQRIGDVIARDAIRFTKILEAALIDTQPLTTERPIGPTSTAEDPAGSQSNSPYEPAYNPVELPEPEAVPVAGAVAGEGELLAANQPIGDPPDAKPSFFVKVEDWKNWSISKLRWVWGVGVLGNVGQATAFVGAAVNDPERGHIYLGIGAALFILIAVVGLLLTAGLVGLLVWNRREISHYITESFRAKADPNMANFALEFEKK